MLESNLKILGFVILLLKLIMFMAIIMIKRKLLLFIIDLVVTKKAKAAINISKVVKILVQKIKLPHIYRKIAKTIVKNMGFTLRRIQILFLSIIQRRKINMCDW